MTTATAGAGVLRAITSGSATVASESVVDCVTVDDFCENPIADPPAGGYGLGPTVEAPLTETFLLDASDIFDAGVDDLLSKLSSSSTLAACLMLDLDLAVLGPMLLRDVPSLIPLSVSALLLMLFALAALLRSVSTLVKGGLGGGAAAAAAGGTGCGSTDLDASPPRSVGSGVYRDILGLLVLSRTTTSRLCAFE